METLKKQLESENVKILSVKEGDKKDYSEFLNRYYKMDAKDQRISYFLFQHRGQETDEVFVLMKKEKT